MKSSTPGLAVPGSASPGALTGKVTLNLNTTVSVSSAVNRSTGRTLQGNIILKSAMSYLTSFSIRFKLGEIIASWYSGQVANRWKTGP